MHFQNFLLNNEAYHMQMYLKYFYIMYNGVSLGDY